MQDLPNKALDRKFPAWREIMLGAFGLALVLISRILRPVFLIRFGNLRNHTIGTLSLHAEGYMADRDLGLLPRRTLDLFFHTEPSANRVLNRLLERRLHVIPAARYAQAFNARIPGGRRHVVELGNAARDRARDHHRAYTQTPQHFFLNEAEKAEARAQLRDHTGMPDDAKFVCFFSRTSSYLQMLHAGGTIRRPEEIPTNSIRNSSILTYLPAAEQLAQRGYWCFRMGAVVDETILCRHERIVDYANSFRSDLLDIYLMSHCDLVLADTTGLSDLGFMFRRPTAAANYVALSQIKTWGGVFIPKKYSSKADGRLLSARELAGLGLWVMTSQDWDSTSKKYNIYAEDNSSEEIAELAIETLQRKEGTWNDNSENQARQQRFRDLAKEQHLSFGGPVACYIASTFLRRHPGYI